MSELRAAIDLFLLSVVTFAAAFAARSMFLADVISDDPPQNGRFEAAYLLLSIENIAAIVAAITLVSVVALMIRDRQLPAPQQIKVRRRTAR